MYYSFVKTWLGTFKMVGNEHFVTDIFFSSQTLPEKPNDVTKQCKQEFQEYFEGIRTKFTVLYQLNGTDFQKSVWNALATIPYGAKVSYQDIANQIGNPKAVRAVGGAIHNNPLMILLPCHRVIGKNGELVGFAHGIHMKKALLDFELRNGDD